MTPDEERADAITAYADHVKTFTDKRGRDYDANERTLLTIGYAAGWDAGSAQDRVDKAIRRRDALERRLEVRWGELSEARAERDQAKEERLHAECAQVTAEQQRDEALAAVRDAQQRAQAAEEALEAIGRERNTWARQLADLRDERDTANARAEDEWRKRCEIEQRTASTAVGTEDAERALARVQELCQAQGENSYVMAYALRRALALDGGQQEAT